MIVADGVLHYLPFETLIGLDGKFLVESVTIAYAPSASVLARMSRDHPRDQRLDLAGFGSPAISQSPVDNTTSVVRGVYTRAGYSFAPLFHAEDELKQVAGLFPPERTNLWLHEKATKAAVKNAETDGLQTIALCHACRIRRQIPEPMRHRTHCLWLRGSDDGILRVSGNSAASARCRSRGAFGLSDRFGETGQGRRRRWIEYRVSSGRGRPSCGERLGGERFGSRRLHEEVLRWTRGQPSTLGSSAPGETADAETWSAGLSTSVLLGSFCSNR